jgi:hypothetical protein
MAKQPEDLTHRILQDIQKTLADHTKRFARMEGRLQHIEEQIDDLSKLVTYSLGQSSETKFRQSQQQSRIDELFEKIERLLSEKEPK